jgi:hypothetical protein
MSPGTVLGEAWQLYKTHWRHLIPLALVFYLILGLISLLLTLLLGWVGALLSSFISILGVFWLQGALVEAVADIRDGRADMSLSETFGRARPKLWTIVGAGILASIAITIGLILFIIPGLFLLTIWCLIVPVIVLEGAGVGESFGRSRELVRGNGWNVFGLIVLTFLILLAATIVLALVFAWLPDWLRGYLQGVIGYSLTVPFVALALTLAYFHLKGEEPVAAAEIEQPAT